MPAQPQPADPPEFTVRVVDHPDQVRAAQWDALLESQDAPTPFMRHAYLRALHESGSAVQASGWLPRWLCVHDGDSLVAACPAYVKLHSWGEYVFDWSWAEAYQRHGLRYYPKLVCAVPFTPVAGSRLLARDAVTRLVLLRAMRQLCEQLQLSSAHLLFHSDDDELAVRSETWQARHTVQFHWVNRRPRAFADFTDFLAELQRDKRKKIAQERRRVAQAGVCFSTHAGAAIDTALWEFFYRCYESTYAAHGSTPYLTRDFFARMQSDMPDNWVMFVAHRDGRRIACSLLAVDPARKLAYGRYWGSIEYLPCLHFEACYYQPLQWCIANGYQRFEGGAQGEHKMARGLLPVRTRSAHWLSHPAFADAVARHLQSEDAGIEAYVDELREHSPFRKPNPQ